MNREETERQMAFIVEQQAKFTANMEKLQERDVQRQAEQQERDRELDARMERTDRRIEQLARSMESSERRIEQLARSMESSERQIESSRAEFREQNSQRAVDVDFVKNQLGDLTVFSALIRDAFLRLSEYAELHEQRIAAIEKTNAERAELAKEMDARLNALMLVVERHIGGHEHSHHQ